MREYHDAGIVRQFLENAVNSASDGNGSTFHVFDDNRVGTNPGVRPDFNRSQDIGAGSYVDMVSDPGTRLQRANRNLLENQAIYAYLGSWMNYNAIWMGNEKAAADIARKWDVGSGNCTPEPVAEDKPFQDELRRNTLFSR